MVKAQKIYCSLDIETSGFDPLKNEILEVGFVKFEVKNDRFKIVDEWTSVFKPSKAVPANILGLTGITNKELENAPQFSKHKEFLQKELGNATIVGHNVIFDIKFLESCGIKFSGEVLDTLDLVQFLMPTHHSYNLENLMHTFGVSHKDAHRALADSKASLAVLEKLLRLYHSFPVVLKREMLGLMEAHKVPYKDLFSVKLTSQPFTKESKTKLRLKSSAVFGITANTIYSLPLGSKVVSDTANQLNSSKDKVLLVVPKVQQVLALWKQGKVSQALFAPEVLFSEVKFLALAKKKNLDLNQIKFVLKILVWKHTNWQTEAILDLNLSFFGGQYKSLVTGGKFPARLTSATACCDHQTFLLLSKLNLYQNRLVVISGLSEFEQQASNNLSTKVSWGYISYLLKSVYSPELSVGRVEAREFVEQGLLASDLFFGLVGALLQTEPGSFQYYKITPETEYSANFQKIRQAAENFADKLKNINKNLGLEEISHYAENLLDFFEQSGNRVRWIEMAENRCTLFSSPLDIAPVVKNILSPYKEVCFVDSLGVEKLYSYFISRLGLQNFTLQPTSFSVAPDEFGQGDLFKSAKKLLPFLNKSTPVVECHFMAEVLSEKKMLTFLGKKALPAAVLFGGQLQLRQFYENNYVALSHEAFLLSQSASGGSNKIFRNFSIHPNSLLLATDKFIVKSVQGQGAVEPVEFLSVKTLILCHLPFEQYTHPYQEALSSQFENPFEDFSLPKAVYNFHSILKFFITPKLEKIYIYDPKLGKSYAKAFKEYLQALPGIKLLD